MEKDKPVREPVWWEKTVEWQFVLTVSKHFRLGAAPLDGDAEAAKGDALVFLNGKRALVEFKRRIADFYGHSEQKKYARHITAPTKEAAKDCFNKARTALANTKQFPGHTSHLFVYGTLYTESNPLQVQQALGVGAAGLNLGAALYWTGKTLEGSVDEVLAKCAVKQQEFDSYVRELAKHRYYEESTESEGASVLSFENGSVSVMDILDYVRANKLDLNAAPAAPKTTAPGMRMK